MSTERYLEPYEIVEQYGEPNRAEFVTYMANRIQTIAKKVQGTIRVTDIGAGDGRLTRRILNELPGDVTSRVELTVVEPEASNFGELSTSLSGANLASVSYLQQGVEEYAATSRPRDHVQIHFHTAYHYPRDTMAQIFYDCAKRLHKDGVGVAVTTSSDNDVSTIRNHILSEQGSGKGKGLGGHTHTSGMLGALFGQEDGILAKTNPYIARLPETRLAVPDDHADEYHDAVARGHFAEAAGTTLGRALGFFCRKTEDEMAAIPSLLEAFSLHLLDRPFRSASDLVEYHYPQP